jgi:hypothetical protein
MRQKAQHFGKLSDIRAAAAEFLRNTGFDQPRFFQKGIVLVVGASELSPGCISVRFGDSFEYLIEKDRVALVAGGLPRIPVIHR